ncbi:MAG: M1 family metallopeptidase, partial [Promethearchaeota archaeon]
LLLSAGLALGGMGSVQPFHLAETSTMDRPYTPSQTGLDDYERFSKGNFTGVELSNISLSVRLDEVNSKVAGNLTVDYYNNDPIPLASIPFHLYASGMQFESRQGQIQILNVTTTGPSPSVLSHSIETNGQIMWVYLPAPVAPASRTSFLISFVTTLPDGLDRSSARGLDLAHARIYTFASCYPMPCVYDELDGWNTDLYVEYGDPFYHDMAFYDLLVEVPENMTVAATGEIIDVQNDGVNTTYHYNAGLPVREVTFSASRYYRVESIEVGHVNITSYYLEDSQPEWEDDVLQWSNATLRLLNHTYGIYPYSTLNIVEQHAYYGGMEYPCQVYLTNLVLTLMRDGQRPSWYLQLLVIHEVAHQWWSQLVGTDAIDWGFLDEGLTCWSHSYYGEYYHGNWERFQYYRYLDISRTFYAENEADSAINQSNYDRPEFVGYVDYTKAPLILERLRVEIGHEAFLAGLSLFFKTYYFRVGTLSALQECLEVAVGASLDWFFLPFFDNPRLPDYSVSDVVYNAADHTLSLTVEDMNEDTNPYPYAQRVPITVLGSKFLAAGSELDLDFPYERVTGEILYDDYVWINGTASLTLTVEGEPYEVRLEYQDYVLVELENAGTEFVAHAVQFVGKIDVVLAYEGILGVLVAAIALIGIDSFRKERTP